MPTVYEERRARLRKIIKAHKIDALLVTTEKNVTYLSGFSGDSTWFLITPDSETLISDFRYITQLREECPGVPTYIRTSKTGMIHALKEVLKGTPIEQLGIEGHTLALNVYRELEHELENVSLIEVNWQIERLRAVKDQTEIAEIREAVRLAEKGFEVLKAILTPDCTEEFLYFELEHSIRKFGGAGVSFHPIIAVGDRAAMPHYRPGKLTISQSPILLVDWGAQTHAGYKSDLTRTLLTNPSTKKFKDIKKFEKVYKTVLESQLLAIEKIAPGVSCREIDSISRDYIKKAGYGKYFDHGLGHGFGLDIHELPRFSQGSDALLEPGMVVTVEPGIYLPGWGGVRIEDDILVTKNGCEVLSSVPKDWDSVHVSC